MKELHFEWDAAKEERNFRKHLISFQEAKSVFYDDFAIEFFDGEHSEQEDRFLLLGLSYNMRLLLVCHCHRTGGSIIRIISARRATRKEATNYHR